jgi:hypothetical protein
MSDKQSRFWILRNSQICAEILHVGSPCVDFEVVARNLALGIAKGIGRDSKTMMRKTVMFCSRYRSLDPVKKLPTMWSRAACLSLRLL